MVNTVDQPDYQLFVQKYGVPCLNLIKRISCILYHTEIFSKTRQLFISAMYLERSIFKNGVYFSVNLNLFRNSQNRF